MDQHQTTYDDKRSGQERTAAAEDKRGDRGPHDRLRDPEARKYRGLGDLIADETRRGRPPRL